MTPPRGLTGSIYYPDGVSLPAAQDVGINGGLSRELTGGESLSVRVVVGSVSKDLPVSPAGKTWKVTYAGHTPGKHTITLLLKADGGSRVLDTASYTGTST